MVTRKIIRDLHNYLDNGNHYSNTINSRSNDELNKTINDNWKNKIGDGLALDFKRILKTENIDVDHKKSLFWIEDNDAQGATIWKSFVLLTNKNEKMDVVISFMVNHDNAFIYLGASHSNLDRYSGASETLERFFKKLKANEKMGHFLQTKFYDLD